MKKKPTIKTYKLVIFIVGFSFLAAIIKLSYVSLSPTVDGINIKTFASLRNTVSKNLYAARGGIYDSEEENLAQSVKSYTVIAFLSSSRTKDPKNPNHVIDKEKTATVLAEILGLEKDSLLEMLNKEKYQVELKRNITEVTKTKIDALELPGIGYTEAITRYYKSGTFASYIVGYAKNNETGEINGELGIEGYFNDILKGENGKTTYQRDAYGYKLANTPEYTEKAVEGSDIYLTINSNIQLICENAIDKLNRTAESNWATLTVMDAKTGEIVGSATNPTFDPNDLNTVTSYLNPLVSYQYEPGSTIKTFSFGAAIETDNYNGSDTFKSGSINVAGAIIKDHNKTGWGEITYDKGFAYSSNVAATKLALKMGAKNLRTYYESLGFGEKTNIELYGEVAGNIKFNYQSELATAAFGQGISTTPIQMLQAFSTISNDGIMLKPYIVKKIVNHDGEVTFENKRTEVKQIFSKNTTDTIKNLMHMAVYDGNSAMWQPKNVTILGKTGTAQIASPNGGYLTGNNDFIRSFATIFPKEDPKYILYIAVKQYQGSTTSLANITTKAIEEIANYAKITNEDINYIVNKKIILNNYISQTVEDTIKKLKEVNIKPIILGDGKYVINQYPLKNSIVFPNDKVFILTNSTNYIMPDLTGYSSNEVRTFANLINLKFKIEEYGYVKSQSILPNEQVNFEEVLNVVLE